MFKIHRTQTQWKVGKMELAGAEEHLHVVHYSDISGVLPALMAILMSWYNIRKATG